MLKSHCELETLNQRLGASSQTANNVPKRSLNPRLGSGFGGPGMQRLSKGVRRVSRVKCCSLQGLCQLAFCFIGLSRFGNCVSNAHLSIFLIREFGARGLRSTGARPATDVWLEVGLEGAAW